MKKTGIAAAIAVFSVAAFGETVIEGDWTVVYQNYPKESSGLARGLSTMSRVFCDVLGESVGLKAKSLWGHTLRNGCLRAVCQTAARQ